METNLNLVNEIKKNNKHIIQVADNIRKKMDNEQYINGKPILTTQHNTTVCCSRQ